MRTFFLLLSVLCFSAGCGGQPSLLERQMRNEKDVNTLLKGARTIRTDLVKSKEDCLESIRNSQVEIAKADEMLAKIDQLLGVKPSPPNPSPSPVPTPGPSPVVPTPAPNPLPQPAPSPVGPVDGKFGVANAVWKIVQTVDSPDRALESLQLASVFSGVAKDIRDKKLEGSLIDPQWHKISMALTAGNKPVIAKNADSWESAAAELSRKIALFYKQGRLKSNQDWADLLDEIALGLSFKG